MIGTGPASDRHVAVTGGTGFVGRHLCEWLRARGCAVTSLVRSPRSSDDMSVDVSHEASVAAFFQRLETVDAVVHLAAIAHRPRGASPADYDRVNRAGTQYVLTAAREAGVSRFVYLSTASVYGELRAERVLTEDLAPAPVGPYATSKARAEERCRDGGSGTMVILRPPAIYSRAWLRNVRTRSYVPGVPIRLGLRLVGQQPRYSLCAVENVVDAIGMALAGTLPSGTYNVGDDTEYTQRMVASIVWELDGVRTWVPIPTAPGRALARLLKRVDGLRSGAFQANLAKLFRGQILDLTKIERYGYVPQRRMSDLIDERDPVRRGRG